MEKQELEHLIAKYEIVRECAEERLNEYNLQLKQQTEAEKPKLRHLDYGYDSDGDLRICLKKCDDTFTYAGPRCLREELTEGDYPIVDKKGNLTDDFKAMSEPLEEFNPAGYKASRYIKASEHGVHIYVCTSCGCGKATNYVSFTQEEAEDFHRKLGQIIATVKRKATKT